MTICLFVVRAAVIAIAVQTFVGIFFVVIVVIAVIIVIAAAVIVVILGRLFNRLSGRAFIIFLGLA